MPQQLPEELANANELMDQAKLDEALEIIEQFEITRSLSSKDHLNALLLKGSILSFKLNFEKAFRNYELAFQISQKLGSISESVEALIGKANIIFMGDVNKGMSYVEEAERIVSEYRYDPTIAELKKRIKFMKSWISFYKGNLNEAKQLAQAFLKSCKPEGFGNKGYIASAYTLLCYVFFFQADMIRAQEFVSKSLQIQEELNLKAGIAHSLLLFGRISRVLRDHNQALKYIKKSLSIEQITNYNKVQGLVALAQVYYVKNDINRALKYAKKAVNIAEEERFMDYLVGSLLETAYYLRIKGEDDLAIEYAERILQVIEKWDLAMPQFIGYALSLLIFTYIDKNQREKAKNYLIRSSKLYNQTKKEGEIDTSAMYLTSYLFPKAYLMKTSTRMRDRVEAQKLFKELIDQFPTLPRYEGPQVEDAIMFSIGNLCDLLIEELSMFNDLEILDEITPLISKGLELAEKEGNYGWLAGMKLLQAKFALIRMNIEEAKTLFLEAQRIAELLDLTFLAWGISFEHDKFLEQIDLWKKLKKENAPFSERIKLASTKRVLEHVQGKSMIEPPEEVDEEPIILLIMDKSGLLYFNHPFVPNWDHSDTFSSFMSAFNTFSTEIFSKSIDRIRIEENTILMQPVDPFLACYVIKGQSYPALQKLTRFTEAIRENSEIWEALNNSVKTSEMLELDNTSALKTVINEIFTK